MIKLSLEVPAAFVEAWTPLADLDFILAHKVLEDDSYASHFATRPWGRELILDNSVHELGSPLPMKALAEAARRVRADYIIPPDRIGQFKQNMQWYEEAYTALDGQRLAPVLCGSTPSERAECVDRFAGSAMLCLPFREDRLSWFREQRDAILACWSRIHLLGVNTIEELLAFAGEADGGPSAAWWSVDTTKPVKFGLRRQSLQGMSDLRTFKEYGQGGNAEAKRLLDVVEVDAEQDAMVRANVAWLRAVLRSGRIPE
jgi:hypothetical protein